MMKRLLGCVVATLSFVAAPCFTAPVPAVAASSVSMCSSGELAATLLGEDGGAGTIHTTVGLVNISTHACTLTPYPRLVFGAHGTYYHPAITKAGNAHGSITVPPGGSASFTIGWSDVDTARGPCTQVANLYLGLPARGLSLWVPVQAKTCNGITQLPMTAGSTHAALPSANIASQWYEQWYETQACESNLLHLTTHPRYVAPAHADALNLKLPQATTLHSITFQGSGFTPSRLAFDPALAVSAQVSQGAMPSVTLCGLADSVPYGIARVSLASAATTRGVRVGSTASAVQSVDGSFHRAIAASGYDDAQYRWTSGGKQYDLTLLFQNARVYAIDYAVESVK